MWTDDNSTRIDYEMPVVFVYRLFDFMFGWMDDKLSSFCGEVII
jgi:hypothetical protein